jgi:hypothetical protein
MTPTETPKAYREHHVQTLTVEGVVYHVVFREYCGYRVWHFAPSGQLYCEWPVVVQSVDGCAIRFATYAENGLKSSPNPNAALPHQLHDAVRRLVLRKTE